MRRLVNTETYGRAAVEVRILRQGFPAQGFMEVPLAEASRRETFLLSALPAHIHRTVGPQETLPPSHWRETISGL